MGRNLVLTVDHAVERDESAKILYKDFGLEARVLARIPKIDVMLLEYDNSTFVGDVPTLKFGFADARLGETAARSLE